MFWKNRFNKILLFILAIIFVFSSISGVFYATGRFNIIKTKGKNIHINDFVRFLNRERNKQYVEYIQNKQDVDIEYIKSETFTRLSLEKMLYNTLLENEVDFYRIEEPIELVMNKVLNDKNMQNEMNKFDIYKFQNFLERIELTENEFLNLLKEEDKKNFLSIFYSQNAFLLSEDIVDKLYNFYNVDKDIYVVTKNIKNIGISDQTNITDEEIDNYYENNKREFLLPKKTKISYIDFGDTIDSLKIDDYIKDKSKIMVDIAKKFDKKVIELGFMEDSKLLDKYDFLINGTVLNEIGFTSSSVKVGNRIYVYHIDDIRNQRYKTKQEAKDEIVKIFNKNIMINKGIDEANKTIQPLISSNGENIFLSDENLRKIKDAGFDVKKTVFNIEEIDNFNKNISQYLIYLKDNQFTPVIFDDDSQKITFVIVNKTSKSKREFFSRNNISKNFSSLVNFSLQETYLSYLRDKYVAKINEKLLRYIVGGEK